MPTYKNETPAVILIEQYTIPPGETLQTYQIISEEGLVKISEEPFYPLALATHIIQFTSAETKQVPESGGTLLNAGVLRLRPTVDVMVKPNSVINPYGYIIAANEERDFLNDNTIETLFLESFGSGQIIVLELIE